MYSADLDYLKLTTVRVEGLYSRKFDVYDDTSSHEPYPFSFYNREHDDDEEEDDFVLSLEHTINLPDSLFVEKSLKELFQVNLLFSNICFGVVYATINVVEIMSDQHIFYN